MFFNWMAMPKLPLGITIVVIMTEMAILAILVIALGVINMAIRGIQLKNMNKTAQWCKIHINQTIHSDVINIFVIFWFLQHFLQCKNADSFRPIL